MPSGLQGGKPIVGAVNKTRDDVTDHPVPHPRSTPTGSYIFTLTPTFTQGLILGQIPILLLALFFGSKSARLPEGSLGRSGTIVQPGFSAEKFFSTPFLRTQVNGQDEERGGDFVESMEWLNFLLEQIVEGYRCKFNVTDSALDEGKENVALMRIQDLVNEARPQSLLGPINVHSVDLGTSAPQFSDAKITETIGGIPQVEVGLNYMDTVLISLSTTGFINFPFPRFAEVPLSLVISLELFSCKIVFTPPGPTPSTDQPPMISDEFLALTISIPPSSVSLRLNIDSSMGPLPSLLTDHILQGQVEAQVKTLISEQGTWKVLLPGISKLRAEAKESFDSSDG